jgi:hypothetical protein
LILGQVFEELSALTGGWYYTVVMGGADPLCEGDIMTLRYVIQIPSLQLFVDSSTVTTTVKLQMV